jgi:all-trans-retinol dehydrogenase (NAD+)
VTPSWIRTPLIEALVNDPTFSDPVLDPEDVSSAIVQQILSGRSAHIVLPKKYKTATGLRAWPYWMQESLRNQKASLMDVRVRYGGKYKRDPRLGGGSLDDLR